MRKYGIWIVLVILVLIGVGGYNGLVGSRESVNKSWANVEAQYQRRSDLIPNLVSTVKGAADFEKSTLTAVMEAYSVLKQKNIPVSQVLSSPYCRCKETGEIAFGHTAISDDLYFSGDECADRFDAKHHQHRRSVLRQQIYVRQTDADSECAPAPTRNRTRRYCRLQVAEKPVGQLHQTLHWIARRGNSGQRS